MYCSELMTLSWTWEVSKNRSARIHYPIIHVIASFTPISPLAYLKTNLILFRTRIVRVHYIFQNSSSVVMLMIVLRGQNWVHFAHRLKCTITMNLNFAIKKIINKKTLKLFSVRGKELFEPIGLQQQQQQQQSDVVCVFQSIFLRN